MEKTAMKSPHYRNFIRILEHELIPVLGCEPEHIEIRCTGNIINIECYDR